MSNTKNNIAIQTKKLVVGYFQNKKEKVIQNNISITLEKGKLIAVLGKNGIGKSTLLRTICGIQTPLEGEVLIHQKNVQAYSNLELATTLSLVLTDKLPISQLTVFDIVALGRQPYTNWIDNLTEKDIDKINEAMQLTEIEYLKDNPFFELSDGQLQRVLIARAIAQDTNIIVLDEPTAHLDIHHTYKILTLLKKLVRKTNKTILLSTHEVNLAIKLADNFVLLNDTKVLSGTSEELLKTTAFHNLFPKDLIFFDEKLQQFLLQTN